MIIRADASLWSACGRVRVENDDVRLPDRKIGSVYIPDRNP